MDYPLFHHATMAFEPVGVVVEAVNAQNAVSLDVHSNGVRSVPYGVSHAVPLTYLHGETGSRHQSLVVRCSDKSC